MTPVPDPHDTPDVIHHVTLNTGHVRESPRSEVDFDVIGKIEPLLSGGTHRLPAPFDAYTIKVTPVGSVVMATVYAPSGTMGARPVVTFGACTAPPDSPDAIELWGRLSQFHDGMVRANVAPDLPRPAITKQPPAGPWLAVVLMLMTPDEAPIMADLERCLAWGWCEKIRRESN